MANGDSILGTVVNSGRTAIATGKLGALRIITVPSADPGTITINISDKQTITRTVGKSHDLAVGEIEAPAVILVASLADSTVKYITNKFFLQTITKPKLERFQIIETFRESKLLFFGERTKIYSITGSLLEGTDANFTFDIPVLSRTEADVETIKKEVNFIKDEQNKYRWSTGLQILYEKYLRGTKLAEQGNIAVIYFENSILRGYPLQLQINRDSNNPVLVQFQMTLAIYDEEYLNITDELKQLYSTTDDQVLRQNIEKARKAYQKASAATETLRQEFLARIIDFSIPEDVVNALQARLHEEERKTKILLDEFLDLLRQGNI